MRKTLPIIAFLLSVALQICAQQKNYDFKEGKLFYKITDATKQYVQVTTEMDELVEATGTLYNNPIEGDITIPANTTKANNTLLLALLTIRSEAVIKLHQYLSLPV